MARNALRCRKRLPYGRSPELSGIFFKGAAGFAAGGTLNSVRERRRVRVAFFYLLLTGLVAITLWRGKADERLAAGVCVAGTILTVAVGDELKVHSSGFHPLAFMVDLGVFLAFLAIALRSTRFWPMWVAGLQLTATIIHPMMMISPALPGMVFGTALAFWSYPILLLIAVGAWRTRLVEGWRTAGDIASRKAIT
jgi:hypothetical protein